MGRAFIQDSTLTDIADAIRVKNGGSTQYRPSEMPAAIAALGDGDMVNCLRFVASDFASVSVIGHGGLSVSLQYSYDFSEWEDWTGTLSDGDRVYPPVSIPAGSCLFVRGNNQTFSNDAWSEYIQFSFYGNPGSVYAYGSVMSLLSQEADQVSLYGKDYCFTRLFEDCACLASAPELPATTLSAGCYYQMFSGCASLVQAPELPATVAADNCYNGMFSGCARLLEMPELPATTLASNCYSNMFYGCTSLTSAPELPATTLASYCYSNMFYGCTSLTSAPELPATTLADYCYSNMFYGCTSLVSCPDLECESVGEFSCWGMFKRCTNLTQAPDLPATNLAYGCYTEMFYVCTSLITAPELPAATLADTCYSQMFWGCSNLSYIKTDATSWSSGNGYPSYDWVYGVAASGTFVKRSVTSITSGSDGIPVGWTVQNT